MRQHKPAPTTTSLYEMPTLALPLALPILLGDFVLARSRYPLLSGDVPANAGCQNYPT